MNTYQVEHDDDSKHDRPIRKHEEGPADVGRRNLADVHRSRGGKEADTDTTDETTDDQLGELERGGLDDTPDDEPHEAEA